MAIFRKRIGLLPTHLPWLCAVLIAIITVFGGTHEISKWLRRSASRSADRGLFADATDRSQIANRFMTDPVSDLLILAKQQRHLGTHRQWRGVMEKIAMVDSPLFRDGQPEVQLEKRLGSLRWPSAPPATAETFDNLLLAGATLDDTAATYLLSVADRNLDRPDASREADSVLSQWASQGGATAAIAWGTGIAFQLANDHTGAKSSFQNALLAEPNHSGAALGLAQSLQELNEPEKAAKLFRAWLDRWPESEPAALGLSRSFRELGRIEDAKRVIEDLVVTSTADPKVWIEAAEVAYLSGDYDEALRRFELADLDGAQTAITIRTAASVAVLAGQAPRGIELFDRYLSGRSRVFRLQSLQARVNNDPTDVESAKELQEILSGEGMLANEGVAETAKISDLFSAHCASCHGVSGLGDGPANRHLYPRSRNLRDDPYRLVSTKNGLPSHDDIKRVIRNGINGTAMRGLHGLSDSEIDQLAAQTLRLRQVGVKRQVDESFAEMQVLVTAEELASIHSNLVTPGEPIAIPDWPEVTPEILSTGSRLFQAATCSQCHHRQGIDQLPFFDNRGMPSPPRDLATEPMKGGRDRGAMFARIRLGMPGTSHPSSPTLTDFEIICLVEHCLALAEESSAPQTNHGRLSAAHRYNLNALRKTFIRFPTLTDPVKGI